MTHCEILSEEFQNFIKFSEEFYAGISSDCPSDIYTSVLEDGSSSEYSSDSEAFN